MPKSPKAPTNVAINPITGRAVTSKENELLQVVHKLKLLEYVPRYFALENEMASPAGDNQSVDQAAVLRGKKKTWIQHVPWVGFIESFGKEIDGNVANYSKAVYRFYVNQARTHKKPERPAPVPPAPKPPRALSEKALYQRENQVEINKKASELRKADKQPTTTNFTYNRKAVDRGYSQLDDAAREALAQRADAINKANRGPPPPETIYKNQESLPQVAANVVGELGGWGWGQYGNVATVIYSIYQDQEGRTRTFQGSAIHAPDHPDARIVVSDAFAEQQFTLLKDQGLPFFTARHHDPTMEPAEKSSSTTQLDDGTGATTPQTSPRRSSSAALSTPTVVPQTPSRQSRTSAPQTPSRQSGGSAPPTPSPAPATQQSPHSILRSPKSQKSPQKSPQKSVAFDFSPPIVKYYAAAIGDASGPPPGTISEPPQADGSVPPSARSTKNGNGKRGSSGAEGAPPPKKQRGGAPKATKPSGSKDSHDKKSKNKTTPRPKTPKVNVQSTTKGQELGDEPGPERKRSSR
ncbi:hypothetical protein BDN72DRAFT_906386 [Pluteus cervinus]|uniref:Uncharacterized protein n=1 Tax=Pluteus cervinus TaxID=181527 RepID=A0ACD2ZZQ3_9AGAR|nr:hypothetical protein BDN72DRAFT_906386 [Pluteus cervinus]